MQWLRYTNQPSIVPWQVTSRPGGRRATWAKTCLLCSPTTSIVHLSALLTHPRPRCVRGTASGIGSSGAGPARVGTQSWTVNGCIGQSIQPACLFSSLLIVYYLLQSTSIGVQVLKYMSVSHTYPFHFTPECTCRETNIFHALWCTYIRAQIFVFSRRGLVLQWKSPGPMLGSVLALS